MIAYHILIYKDKLFYFLDSPSIAAIALEPTKAANQAAIINTFNQKINRPANTNIAPAAITHAFCAGVRFSNTPTEILNVAAMVFKSKSLPLSPIAERIFCASGGISDDDELTNLVIYPAASHSSLFISKENIL